MDRSARPEPGDRRGLLPVSPARGTGLRPVPVFSSPHDP